MADAPHLDLSRRERQIMYVLYDQGKATAQEVQEGLPDPPSDSAVRATLRILEDKGYACHERNGPRYVYFPVRDPKNVSRSALDHMLETFFDGSTERAMAALLDVSAPDLSEDTLDNLAGLIDLARKDGR